MRKLRNLAVIAAAGLLGAPAAAQTTATWDTGAYVYDGAGNIKSIGTTEQFRYDALSRLLSGTAGSGQSQVLTYDAFGNILTIAINGAPPLTIGVKPATNRASEPANIYGNYDAAGRLTQTLPSQGLGEQFAFDAADMIVKSVVDGVTKVHLYSPGDERIASITLVNGAETASEWTLRDPSGKVLRRVERTASQWSWKEDYIYRGSTLLAAEVSTPARTLHYFPDHLGSPRLITANGGTKVAFHTYFPFGDEATAPTQDPEKLKFTSHERDAASLDYMHARYYAPRWGRFLSPDPAYDFARVLHKPQGWNRYSYVENNPVNLTDPNGKCVNVATCAWQYARWIGPIVVREVGSRTFDTVRTGAQMYAMQRLSGFTYAQPAVTPAAMSEAQDGIANADDAEAGAQDKKLSGAEVDALEEGSGESAHDIKKEATGDKKVSKYDLYKDKDGHIYVKPKNSPGRGEPTGYNINDFFGPLAQ